MRILFSHRGPLLRNGSYSLFLDRHDEIPMTSENIGHDDERPIYFSRHLDGGPALASPRFVERIG